MAGSRSSVRASAAAAALLVALGAVACASSDDQASPATRPPASTTSSPRPAATSTTSTTEVGPVPIPTDPAELASCDDVPDDGPAAMPARRWPELPTGWQVRYAYTTRPEGEGGSSFGWSTLVRVGENRRVTGLVLVTTGPTSNGATSNATVRGVPGWVGPQTNRSGPTGALEVDWVEDDRATTAVSRGLDDAALRSFVEDLRIDDGAVTADPPGWQLLGSGRSDGVLSATVFGITPPGTDLLETGYAPVEVQVEERIAGSPTAGAIHVPGGLDVEDADVFLLDADGRPALLTSLDDGGQLLQTTTADGAPASASGPATGADLARVAGRAAPIQPDDERLVGVPMGTPGSSPGRFCR